MVNLFGESVLCTISTGDHYRKGMILTRCDFSRCANGLESMLKWKSSTCLLDRSHRRGCVVRRMERGRKIQLILPDMGISISEEGNLVMRLLEIKLISSSKTRYTIHREGQDATRAVDKRSED